MNMDVFLRYLYNMAEPHLHLRPLQPLPRNHNSVLGIRDVARDTSVEASVVESEKVDDWLDRPVLFSSP